MCLCKFLTSIAASHVNSVGTAKPPSLSDSQSISHVDSPSDDGTGTGSQLSQGGSHDSKQTLDRQTLTDKPTRPTSLPTRATSRCVNLTSESVNSPKEDFISPVFQPDKKRIVVARKLTDCELQSKGIESQSVVPESPTSESVNSPKEDLISPVSQPDKKRIVVARILTDSELQSKYVASQSVVPESLTSESAKSPKEDLISPVFQPDKKRMVVARKLSDCELQSKGVAPQSIVPKSPTSESAKSSVSPKEDLVSQPGKKRIVVARKLTDSESQSEDVASPSVVPESPTSESAKSSKSQKEDLVSQPGKKRIVVARKLTDSESQSEDVASPSVIPESPQDLSTLKERDSQLPKISQFMDRCKQTEVPYISPETPPQVECVAKSTTSVAFPELSCLLKSNVFAKKYSALTRLRSFPPGPYTTTPTSTLSEDPVTTVSVHDAKAHIPGRGSLTEKKIDVPCRQVGEKGLKEEGSKGHPSSRQSEEVSCTSGSRVDTKASRGANASNSSRLSRLTVEEIVAKHAEKCLDTASVKSPEEDSQTSISSCIIPSKKAESSTPGTLSTSTEISRDNCPPLSTSSSISTSVDSSTKNTCTVDATSTMSGTKQAERDGQIADTASTCIREVADSTVQVMKQIQSDKSTSIAESLTDEPVQCLPSRSCTMKPSMDVQVLRLPQKPVIATVKKKASSVPPAGPPTKRSRLTESRDSTVPPRKYRIKQNESVRKSRSLSPIRAPTSRLRAKSVASSKEGCQFEDKSRHNSGTKSIAVKRSLSDGDAHSMRERGHDYDSSSVSKRHRLDSGRKSPPLTSTSKTNDRRSRSSRVSVSPARDRAPEQPSCSRIKSRASSVSSCGTDWEKERQSRGTERDRERHSSSKLSYRRSRESSPVGFRPEPTYYVDHEHRPPSPWPPHDHWYNHSPPLLERRNVRRASSSLLGPPPVPLPHAPQRNFIYSPPPPLYHEPLPHLYGGSLPLPYGPLARARSVYDQRTRDYDYATDVRYGRRGPPAVPPPPPHDWYRMHGDRYYQ